MEEEDEEDWVLLMGGPDEADRGALAAPGALLALCDPSRLAHQLSVLLLMCFLGFGSYVCYDNPAALQTQTFIDLGWFFFFFLFCLILFHSSDGLSSHCL
uniref:Uncharacterized protein n=1 Tax=Aotus nancymaae TaxID=37293 RepID=A0A2K5BXQ3_AOTNA